MEKVKRYRCVKEFEVENYDDDCFRIEGEYITIKPGGIGKMEDIRLVFAKCILKMRMWFNGLKCQQNIGLNISNE